MSGNFVPSRHEAAKRSPIEWSNLFFERTCRVLVDGPAPGAWNMAVDETLLESAGTEGRASLRFYQWSEPTLSLGYFQAHADRQQHSASRSCAMVRRSSGGGAILHDVELTYCFAAPLERASSVHTEAVYSAFHFALIRALAGSGIEAQLFEPSQTQPAKESAFLCFERRTKGDVLFGQEKIAGSAQRRRQGALLQHGSVLLRRSAVAPELAGVCDLTERSLTAEDLAKSWIGALKEEIRLTLSPCSYSRAEKQLSQALAEEKFGSPVWTLRR